MSIGEWFRRTELEVINQYGDCVYLIAINISCDKTHVTRQGNIKVWPAYVTITNCTTKVITSIKGSRLVGYCPLLPYSRAELFILLKAAGCPHYRKDTVKLTGRYFESEFLRALVAPIVEHQKAHTALALAVGTRRSLLKGLYAVRVMSFVCKY